MKSTLKSLLLATTTATLMTSTAAMAYEAGDILVKVGAAHVAPNTSSDQHTAISDLRAAVDTETQVGLTLTYMIKENIGIELLAATPFQHQITASGAGLGGTPVAKTTQLPPTVTVNYYPEMSGAFQPYIGAGINYTNFLDTDSHLAGVKVDMDDSWGVALHAGIDIEIDKNWSFNASAWYIDIDTTASLKGGGLDGKIDVEIDPMVYMLGVSYKF